MWFCGHLNYRPHSILHISDSRIFNCAAFEPSVESTQTYLQLIGLPFLWLSSWSN